MNLEFDLRRCWLTNWQAMALGLVFATNPMNSQTPKSRFF